MNAKNKLVVHIFVANSLSYKAFHGKVIWPSDHFHSPQDNWPNTQLLLFRYQQCVIRCLRGWSCFWYLALYVHLIVTLAWQRWCFQHSGTSSPSYIPNHSTSLLSADVWWGQGLTVVLDKSSQQLLVVPINFLCQGMVDNFTYILQCIQMVFVMSGGHMCNEQGIALDPSMLWFPVASYTGTMVNTNYLEPSCCNRDGSTHQIITIPCPFATETTLCRSHIGPHFKFDLRPPNPGNNQASIMSNSKQSSTNQVHSVNCHISLLLLFSSTHLTPLHISSVDISSCSHCTGLIIVDWYGDWADIPGL